jgi:hypothetical protein
MVGAVDFSYSNGHFESPHSLHYIKAEVNPYTSALLAIMRVFDQYSLSKHEVYGFGAQNPWSSPDCFPLNGTSHLHAVDLKHEYLKCLKQIQMAGPSELSAIVRKCRAQVTKTAS